VGRADDPFADVHRGHATACAPNPLSTPGDLTLAIGLERTRTFRLRDVRLVGARNVTLRGAYVGVVRRGPDGDYVLPPLAVGWPTLSGGTISSSSLVPAAGADIDRSSEHAILLRLHVDDATADGGFQDIGLVYRSGLVRRETRLEYTQLLVANGTCQ